MITSRINLKIGLPKIPSLLIMDYVSVWNSHNYDNFHGCLDPLSTRSGIRINEIYLISN